MAKNSLVVYTCITGGYDTLREIRYKSPDIDYICFTDNAKLASKTWKVLPLPNEVLSSEKSSVKKQRLVKLLPHKWFPDYTASLWIDSNIEIIGDLSDFFSKYSFEEKFLYVNKHPSRDCIYREQLAIIRLNKDTFENTSPQINRYRDEGFPEHYGLAETNILLRKHGDKNCIKLMELWAKEIKEGSHRDQLSFNYCVWKCDCKDKIKYLDEKYYNLHVSDNAFFCLRRHVNIGKIDAFPNQTKTIDTKELAKKEEEVVKAVSSEVAKSETTATNVVPEKKDPARKPVSVVVFTHDRTNVARETLKSLFKNVKYSGELNWVLADDRSTKQHLAEMKNVFIEAGVKYELCQTTKTRFGLGASMNIGLQKAFKKSDIVLRVEDDWILEKELQLDRFVKTLEENDNVAGIRLGMVGGGVNIGQNLFKDASYKVLVGPNDSSWLFVNQVALVHKRIHENLGWYIENVGADRSEEEFRTRFNRATENGRKRWLLLVPKEMKWRTFDDPSLWFIHIGRSTLGHTIYREPKRYNWIYDRSIKHIEEKPPKSAAKKNSWPTISVMMTTHNRTAVACFCLESLIQKLRYSGRIHWIVCDDRSEDGHCKALESKFKQFGTSDYVILRTSNERYGLGASMNNGLKEAFKYGEIVLTTEDDWYLKNIYNIDDFVKLIYTQKNIAGIRIGAMGQSTLTDSSIKGFKRVSGDRKRQDVFNNQIMIRHKRIFDAIGYMKENCDSKTQEYDLYRRYNFISDYGRSDKFIVLWPSNYDVNTLYGKNNPFYHIGLSTRKGIVRRVRQEYSYLNDEELDRKIRNSFLENNVNMEKILVSITSYPKRITNVGTTINNLLTKQTRKPDEIHLWLSKIEFPNKEKDLPQNLISVLSNKNVYLHWLDANTFVHKRHEIFKIANSSDCVFFFDDDVDYNPKLIETVMKDHQKYPNTIINYEWYSEHIYYGRKIIYANQGRIKVPSTKIRWCGQSMIPVSIYPKEVLLKENVDIRDKISPICDESWLTPWLVYHNIPIFCEHFGWGENLDKNIDKNDGLKKYTHEIQENGYERRDNWLNNVLQKYPFLLKKYIETFNYGKRKRIVVSLTSWKKRINNVCTVVKSIFNNKIKPDMVVLNLSTDEFPNKEAELPSDLLQLIKDDKRFQIYWIKENTGVFKKFIPTIKRLYPEDYYLFTIDDDELYDSDYIDVGLKALQKAPAAVIANRRKNDNGVWGGMFCCRSFIFKPDYWTNITQELIEQRMNDPYTNKYFAFYGIKLITVYETHTKKYNAIFENRGQTGAYSQERLLLVNKIVDKIFTDKFKVRM